MREIKIVLSIHDGGHHNFYRYTLISPQLLEEMVKIGSFKVREVFTEAIIAITENLLNEYLEPLCKESTQLNTLPDMVDFISNKTGKEKSEVLAEMLKDKNE